MMSILKAGAAALLASAVLAPLAAQASTVNQIYNPGWEAPPTRANGGQFTTGNTGNATGWIDGGGGQLNVVQVDGPGSFNYQNYGPANDATGTATAAVPRRYLDIVNDTGTVFQRFTPVCSGPVRFGAYFSTRANNGGIGKLEIINGSNPNGTNLATSNAVNLPMGNSATDPWTLSSGTANLIGGQTYVFKVTMDNNLNMDEAYVYFQDCPTNPVLPDVSNPVWPTTPGGPIIVDDGTFHANHPVDPSQFGELVEFPDRDPTPGQSACCGPWNAPRIPEQLSPAFPAGAVSPYQMSFLLAPGTDAAMKAWLNYLHAMDPSITTVTMTMKAADLGMGATHASNGSIVGTGVTATWNWVSGTLTSAVTGSFGIGAPFAVNKWYGFRTDISHNGTANSPYFTSDCITDAYYFRWQASANRMGSFSFGGAGGPVRNSGAITIDAGQRLTIVQRGGGLTASGSSNR